MNPTNRVHAIPINPTMDSSDMALLHQLVHYTLRCDYSSSAAISFSLSNLIVVAGFAS